jgi:threonine/homoserine/homoserine lactone efflux protein
MKQVFFLIAAYVMGFIAAIPTGPVQIEVIRRSINGHVLSAMNVILGALIADMIYGMVAFLGIAPFFHDEKIRAYFWLAGSFILAGLSLLIIKNTFSRDPSKIESRYLRKKRWGLIGGFIISIINPAMIFWWLIGANLFLDLNLIDRFTTDVALSFVTAGCTGIATYLSLLSLIFYWIKQFISVKIIKKINLFSAILLIIIAVYFLISSITKL